MYIGLSLTGVSDLVLLRTNKQKKYLETPLYLYFYIIHPLHVVYLTKKLNIIFGQEIILQYIPIMTLSNTL